MPHEPYKVKPTKTVIHDTHCCAMNELDCLGLSKSPEEALASIGPHLLSYGYPRFIIFTGVVGDRATNRVHDGGNPNDYGQNLANFVTLNNLGTTASSDPVRNHTGNMVKVWVWSVNVETLHKYLKFAGVRPEEESEDEPEDDGA